jgi:uncharacterized protein YciI
MTEPKVSWDEIIQRGKDFGLDPKQLYMVNTTPVNGMAPVLAALDEHLKWQVHLEEIGVMFVAGAVSNDGENWDGEGFFVYRAESLEEATKIAAQDPMHASGARAFRVRKWLLAEGSYQLRVRYSTGRAEVL